MTENKRLTAVMAELGITDNGLAHRMFQVSKRDGGPVVSLKQANIKRYRLGENVPKPRTVTVMAEALSIKAGYRITAAQIGYAEPPGTQINPWRRFAEQCAAQRYAEFLASCGFGSLDHNGKVVA
ncbi:hypothetical protein [Nocardia sp. NPDC127526]|uniref:hypothetical protein n=1 Tax=Nocardia sp. NPDC127526 TaxID=3345393 RepID=UPI003630A153